MALGRLQLSSAYNLSLFKMADTLMQLLTIQRHQPSGIAELIMDNRGESNNLVTDKFIDEMMAAIAELSADESVTGVILSSAKPIFMAGADLKLMVQGYESQTQESAFAFSQKASQMHRAIEQSGKCWVALINGLALGGGMELALACHYRILEASPKAVVGFPEVNVGLLPGSGGTQRLIRIAGAKVAIDLLVSGRNVTADEAIQMGIVDVVLPAGEMEAAARKWLERAPDPVKPWDYKNYTTTEQQGLMNPSYATSMTLAVGAIAKKGFNNPAPAAIMSCLYEGAILPFDKALAVESKYFAQLLTSPVSRNIIRTTFINKSAAERGAGRPSGVPKSDFKKVGVIGAGMMGAGIALVASQAGLSAVLIDRDAAIAEKGKSYSQKYCDKRVTAGSMNEEERSTFLARIVTTDDFALLAGCDIIIEAVFEDIEIKAEATRKVEAVVGPNTLYCTNTSTLPVSKLAEASQRPEQFIGMHFFSPVERMGLVELIKGHKTSATTLARALDFVALLRKTPIVVNDSRGFYTSRVFQTLIHEGARMLGDGVPPAIIENAAKTAGFPVGPLALLDEVTFDLPLKIVDQAIEQEGDLKVLPAGVDVLRKMTSIGRSGRKSGGGFYAYGSDGTKKLWEGLSELFPSKPGHDADEVARRLLHIQALETARCLEENVIETSADGDLGAVYGWGFPAWTGGTLSYIDTLGVTGFVKDCDRMANEYGPRFLPSDWLRARATRGQTFY
jgi:3-hydroxyacyl-CoA dehydrogenase/enoyl-CoA hydratase/3-hydroxybutyryl-CoA epimerase